MSESPPWGEVIEFPAEHPERERERADQTVSAAVRDDAADRSGTEPAPVPADRTGDHGDEAADRSGTDTMPGRDTRTDESPDGTTGSNGDRMLVDRPSAPEPGRLTSALRSGAEHRRPVLPAWARSPAELHATGRWLAGYAAHAAAYHAVRTPSYGGRLAVRSPRGAARVVSWISRWVADAEAAPLHWDAGRLFRRGESFAVGLPRVFRTAEFGLFHAAACRFGNSSRTSCGGLSPRTRSRP